MKNKHPVITLLGSNSGNNVGDAAILSAILEVLSKELPGAEFIVPSTKPEFVNKFYGNKYNVKGISLMPWTGSLRFFGLPTLAALAKSDAALICDGIIFGKKLWNPGFNMLITLAPLVPFCKMFGTKLVCYSTGIGPFPEGKGAKIAQYLIQNCDLVMMRERDSEKLTKDIGVTKPVELTGDAAFINPVSEDAVAGDILAKLKVSTDKPFLGINVTSYLDGWLEKNNQLSDRAGFVTLISDAVLGALKETENGFKPIIFSTHPMDLEACKELAQKLDTQVISNGEYLSHDMQAVMRRCELFLGMRFHSCVLASAVYAPLVALIYAPKVRGYMRLLGCEDLALEFGGLTSEKLCAALVSGWQKREALRERQRPVVDELKAGAYRAAKLLVERVYPELVKQQEVVTSDVKIFA